MDKATLKQKSKKELINIANELGLHVTAKHTVDMLAEAILQALAKGPQSGAGGAAKTAETAEATGGATEKKIAAARSGEEVRDLPKGYGDTKIVALVRDPYWIFVYWEISHEKKQLLARMGANTERLVLRAYDITGVAFDGFNANSFVDVETDDTIDNWYLKLPSPARSWCVDLGAVTQDGNFVLIARSNTVLTPRDIPSERKDEDERWAPSLETFTELLKITKGGGLSLGGLAEGETSSGLTPLLPSSESSSAIFSSSSSDLVQRKAPEKDFFLIVNTELIVYGATMPDAHVTLQGQPVQLRPDGTFSVRFALPDGEQIIPVCATNADGDMTRAITPIVRRTTE